MTKLEKTAFRQLSGRTVEWEIKGFKNLPFRSGERMHSPTFWVSNSNWQISFLPKGDTSTGTEYVSLYLNSMLSKNYPVKVIFTLLIKINNSEIAKINPEKTFNEKYTGWGKHLFAERSKILECLKPETSNDTVTVGCSIRIQNSIKEVSTQTPSLYRSPSNVEEQSASSKFSEDETRNGSKELSNVHGVQVLSNNLKELYLNKEHCDVKIKIGSKELSAHKNILSARSPVFASMFRHEMAENVNGTLDISDCDPESFEVFLEFLYTGKMDGVCYSNAIGLYKTADKYSVDDLKEECVASLCGGMEAEHICDILDMAAVHEEAKLLETAINFFIQNIKDIFVTARWQKFMIENTTLANECLKKMAEKKS